MRISNAKQYHGDIVVFAILGIIIAVGSIVLTAYYYTGAGADDYFLLFIAVPCSILCFLFPIILNYRQLTYVLLDNTKCTSYTLLHKKLCTVDLQNTVYYTLFDVWFPYRPKVKYIALSNDTFECDHNNKKIDLYKRKFYGKYNRKSIVIFPYDERTVSFLNFDDYRMIN